MRRSYAAPPQKNVPVCRILCTKFFSLREIASAFWEGGHSVGRGGTRRRIDFFKNPLHKVLDVRNYYFW